MQPPTCLLRLLDSKEDTTRFAAASAVLNCPMADDCRQLFFNHNKALGVFLDFLISPNNRLVLESVSSAPGEMRNVLTEPTKERLEKVVEVRLVIVESFLLLCKTAVRLKALLECDAFIELVERSTEEHNEEIARSLTSISEGITVGTHEEAELKE